VINQSKGAKAMERLPNLESMPKRVEVKVTIVGFTDCDFLEKMEDKGKYWLQRPLYI
jgi:hypothetical protein